MKYLLVDDEPLLVSVFKHRLEPAGFDVTSFDGNPKLYKEYKEWVAENKPEIVQLDGLDGRCFEIFDMLKEVHPDAHYFICSGDDYLSTETSKRGIPFVSKGDGPRAAVDYAIQILNKNP